MNLIKGLSSHFIEETETVIYYNQEMLNNNLIIEEVTQVANLRMETSINIKHFNDLDANHYALYCDIELAPIQVYRILADVFAMYQSKNLNEFLDIVETLSIYHESASMQEEEIHRQETYAWIKGSIDEFKTALKRVS